VYSEELPILSQMHFINKKPSVLIISCKAPEWRYEQEWRYLHVMNPMSQDKSNNPLKLTALNAVKAIYLGVEAKKYNEQYVNELVDVARNLGIQLYEMKFSENEYRLIPHRIEIT
jgi:hypothetical protein